VLYRKIFIVIALLFVFNKNANAQFSFTMPISAGETFDDSVLNHPVKLVVHNFVNANDNQKQKMINLIRDVGFKDTIVLNTPPKYPSTKYKDSVNAINPIIKKLKKVKK
jgi:hypothetical protein